MNPTRFLLATRSHHKAREIRHIMAVLSDTEFVTLDGAGLPPAPAEDGIEIFETFEENATAKARYFAQLSSLPVIADDSGIEVDALDGKPGVRSKRFAEAHEFCGNNQDEANNQKLLESLLDVSPEMRTARYVCVAALVLPDRRTLTAYGSVSGLILDEYRGTSGFGYDPLFFVPELGQTFAQVEAEVKNRFSHRGRAFRALALMIQENLTNNVALTDRTSGH